MKKTISIMLIILSMALIFSGCSKDDNVDTEEVNVWEETTTPDDETVTEPVTTNPDITPPAVTEPDKSGETGESNENSNNYYKIADISYEFVTREEFGREKVLKYTMFLKNNLGESVYATLIPVISDGKKVDSLHESIYFETEDKETGEFIYETFIEDDSYQKLGEKDSKTPFAVVAVTPIFDGAIALANDSSSKPYLPKGQNNENVVAIVSLDGDIKPELVIYEEVSDKYIEWKYLLLNPETKLWEEFKVNRIDF